MFSLSQICQIRKTKVQTNFHNVTYWSKMAVFNLYRAVSCKNIRDMVEILHNLSKICSNFSLKFATFALFLSYSGYLLHYTCC